MQRRHTEREKLHHAHRKLATRRAAAAAAAGDGRHKARALDGVTVPVFAPRYVCVNTAHHQEDENQTPRRPGAEVRR